MGTERKRKVSLFDVMEDPSLSSKNTKSNGLGVAAAAAAAGGGSNLINKWNGKAYSQRYFEILEKRRDLPVWLQKDEFLNTLKSNQTLILVGETGSGKTTQVGEAFNFSIIDLDLESVFNCKKALVLLYRFHSLY